MDIFQSIILGIVEGITEFLPISSTGHLILTSKILAIPESEFLKSFEIAIQLGAIAAVIVLYRKAFTDTGTLKKLFVAFLPTAALGFLFYKIIKSYLLGSETVVLWALLLGGIAIIACELLFFRKNPNAPEGTTTISYPQAFLVGLFQAVAIVPGVSRSAATILGGLFMNIERKTIVEFSFLLAVPTILAATGFDLLKNSSSFSSSDLVALAFGFITAFAVALFAINFLLRFIKTNTFILFGVYRIVLAFIFWFVIF